MFHSKECINNVRVKMLNFLCANDKKESRALVSFDCYDEAAERNCF